jgi:hypothetical protein
MRRNVHGLTVLAQALLMAGVAAGCELASPMEPTAAAGGPLLGRAQAATTTFSMQGRFTGPSVFAAPGEEGAEARCVANLEPDGENPGAVVTFVGTYSGVFSRMGRVRAFSTFCFAPGEPPAQMRQGTWVITAANGDELRVHFEGTVDDYVSPGVVRWRTVDTIVGGTGRFAGANGGGTCLGTSDLTTGIVEGTCDYRITH